MANLIRASQYGQPVAEQVGKWTFGVEQDSFTGEMCATPEDAIRDAKSYYEEQGENHETIYIAEMEEASVSVPDLEDIAEIIDDRIYDEFFKEEFCLFDRKEIEKNKLASEQFNADICAAMARYLTATNTWPKYYVYGEIREVKL